MNYINYINKTSLTILYSNMVSSISSTQPLVATHPGDPRDPGLRLLLRALAQCPSRTGMGHLPQKILERNGQQ